MTATLTDRIAEVRKAIAGFVVPGLVVLVGALTDNSPAGPHVTAGEWLLVLIAALGTGGAVYGARNGRVPVDVEV